MKWRPRPWWIVSSIAFFGIVAALSWILFSASMDFTTPRETRYVGVDVKANVVADAEKFCGLQLAAFGKPYGVIFIDNFLDSAMHARWQMRPSELRRFTQVNHLQWKNAPPGEDERLEDRFTAQALKPERTALKDSGHGEHLVVSATPETAGNTTVYIDFYSN